MASIEETTLLFGRPNSGTDYLCGVIRKHLNYYDKEFFNPVTNPAYRGELVKWGFGAEWPSYVKNLKEPVGSEDAISLWTSLEYDFNKEALNIVKQHWFKKMGFRCIFLDRPYADIFPPSRHRVMGFYDAYAYAHGLQGTLWQRCSAAYRHMGMQASTCDYSIDYRRLRSYDAQQWERFFPGVRGKLVEEEINDTFKLNFTKGFKDYA